jgi:hypothetical protein
MKVTLGPQQQRIISYLSLGKKLTRNSAKDDLAIHELSSRIGELEGKGFRFIRNKVKAKNRFGDLISYMEYRLDVKRSKV